MRQKTKQSKPTWRKTSGEEKYYFIFHNLMSVLLFFYIATKMNLFSQQSYSLLDIFSFNFIKFIGVIIGLTILLGFVSRILVYGIFWFVNYYRNERKQGKNITTIKSLGDINKGINEFTTFSYFKTVIYSSILFAIGAVTIIQLKLFKSNSLSSLIGAYLIVKISVYLYVWAKDK